MIAQNKASLRIGFHQVVDCTRRNFKIWCVFQGFLEVSISIGGSLCHVFVVKNGQVPFFELIWCWKLCKNCQQKTTTAFEYIFLENILNDFLFPIISQSIWLWFSWDHGCWCKYMNLIYKKLICARIIEFYIFPNCLSKCYKIQVSGSFFQIGPYFNWKLFP